MNFPEPKFKIGDIVRLSENDDPDEVAMVVGVRLRYYDHLRRHVFYYELADKMSSPPVTNDWLDSGDIELTTAETETQKWHIAGGEVPWRKSILCWQCGQPRIDDSGDCPYCSAEREPYTDGINDKPTACAIARDLCLDDAIRTVAKSGQNHDNGPNWYAIWEDMDISATFGAGTNSASVGITAQGGVFDELNNVKIYSEYGSHIETFRYGPWVHRLIDRANELREAKEIKRQQAEDEGAHCVYENFREVPF